MPDVLRLGHNIGGMRFCRSQGGRSQRVHELCLPNRERRRERGGERERRREREREREGEREREKERRVGRLLTVNDGCRIESWRPHETGWLNCSQRLQSSACFESLGGRRGRRRGRRRRRRRRRGNCSSTQIVYKRRRGLGYFIIFIFHATTLGLDHFMHGGGPTSRLDPTPASHTPLAGSEAAVPGEKRGPGAAA